jgi:hypothetical protein
MIREETRVALTCPSCGNDQNFQVKTLQMHVVHLDDSRIEVSEDADDRRALVIPPSGSKRPAF